MSLTLRGLYPRFAALAPSWRWGAGAAMLGVIAALSSLPVGGNSSMPDARSFLLNWGHQFLYGALAVCLAAGFGLRLERPRSRAILAVLGLVTLIGLLDELHQGTLPQRDSSLWDLGSDTLGAALALTVASWTARRQGPVLEPGPVLFCLGLSLAWNCVPAFIPSSPLSELLP